MKQVAVVVELINAEMEGMAETGKSARDYAGISLKAAVPEHNFFPQKLSNNRFIYLLW